MGDFALSIEIDIFAVAPVLLRTSKIAVNYHAHLDRRYYWGKNIRKEEVPEPDQSKRRDKNFSQRFSQLPSSLAEQHMEWLYTQEDKH